MALAELIPVSDAGWRALLPDDLARQTDRRLAGAPESPLIVVARLLGRVIACGIVVRVSAGAGELLLLVVVPGMRRRGIAGGLLQKLQAVAADRGINRLYCSWTGRSDNDLEPLAAFLAARAWAPATVCGRNVTVHAGSTAAFLRRMSGRLPPVPGRIIRWDATGRQQRAELQRQLATMDLPPGLDPFRLEDSVSPELCRAVCIDGRIVVWFMARWASDGHVWIPASYGLHGYNGAGISLPMWAGVFEDVAGRSPDATCGWDTPEGFGPMSRFLRRRQSVARARFRTRWETSYLLDVPVPAR